MAFQGFRRLRTVGRVVMTTGVVVMTLIGVAGPAAAQQQPSNVRGFSGGGYSGVRSTAESQAVNAAHYSAASAGWQASWCQLISLTSYPVGSGWNAIAELRCVQPPTVTLPGVPWNSDSNLGLCIGGELCHNVQLNMPVAAGPIYVSQITVNAHDDYGDKTGAVLGLFADGVQIGSWRDVLRAGSNHTFYVNRSVSQLTFRSQSESRPTDETIINSIAVR